MRDIADVRAIMRDIARELREHSPKRQQEVYEFLVSFHDKLHNERLHQFEKILARVFGPRHSLPVKPLA